MHAWLDEALTGLDARRGTRINVIGPRGGAKSTIGTLAYPLWLAVRAREPYIWIVSDTKHQAAAHLDNLRAELLDNELLAADYPAAVGRGPAWRSNQIALRNGVVIEAFGTGQRIRGRRRRAHRPSLIVCDDLQNDRHIVSPLARERSREWFHGALLKAGAARTNVVNLATALHRDALALELHRSPGWNSRVFRAIERWPDNAPLWEEWEAIYADAGRPDGARTARQFFDDRRAAMLAGAELLWPEEEPLYALMCMRVESGRASFEREKQGSPLNPEQCEWPEAYFGPHAWFDDWPRRLVVKTMALDPSKGADARRGDYSAYVLLGFDERGVAFVEADLARRPTPQMTADGVELARRFRPDAFGVEANQYQDLLAAEFAAEFLRQGLLDAPPWTLDNRVNKLVRIRRLGPYLSAGRIKFKTGSPGTQLLVNQLRDFPLADHDDGPDALEMALRLAIEVTAPHITDDRLGDRLVEA
jgi:predicted phage terminase large subunit-like protein